MASKEAPLEVVDEPAPVEQTEPQVINIQLPEVIDVAYIARLTRELVTVLAQRAEFSPEQANRLACSVEYAVWNG